MAYCSNCGAELKDGMKFCSECGKAVENSNSTRQQEYAGKVIKCPHCGETVDAFVLQCPSCGYSFRDTKSSEALRQLSDQLRQTSDYRQQILLIKNFPIPNNKEDLFEFVNLAASNIDISMLDDDISDDNPQKAISKAWKAKLQQVYTKALVLFDEGDPHFSKIKKVYDATQTRLYTQEKKQKNKYGTGLVITVSGSIIALVILIIGLVAGALGNHSMDSSRANLIILIGGIILIVNAVLSGKGEGGIVAPIGSAVGCIIAVLISTIYPMLDKSWSMVSSRSNLIMLMAVIGLIISVINIIGAGKRKYKNKY